MKQTEYTACLLLGSNILPEHYLPSAVNLIQKQLEILKTSSVWETSAIGSEGPNFLNAALLVATSFDALSLKEQILRPIEAQLGRVRTQDKNAARTIDIDILIFNEQVLDRTLWDYAFRAVPAAEILPGVISETGENLKDAAARLARMSQISLRVDVVLTKFTKVKGWVTKGF
jgi:2-amino-4-hydroxy-6-hydroxymethyldihydropteridine diphosphokinase